jgi:hypothetical protein
MLIARQSTARTVTVGPILDADGVAVTGCVVGDLKLSKNGGAPAALNASATLTHRHTGFYSLALTASDFDTVGTGEVTIDDTVNAMPMKEFTVVEEAVYDALFAASALGYVANAPVNVAQWLGSAPATPTTAGVPEVDVTHWVGGAVEVPGTTGRPHVSVRTIEGTDATDYFNALIGTGSGFTAIPWNSAWDAEVQSEVQDAIEANSLDRLVKIAVDTDFATTVHVDSVVGQLAQTSDGGFSRATDSLEAVRDRGDAAWIAATGFSTHSAADVWAVATRTLTAGTNIVLAKGTGVTGFNDLTAAQVNAEVDTALTDIHLHYLLAADYDPAGKPGVATALLNELVESDAGVSRFTANALEQGPSGGGGVADWTADERTAIRAILGIPASGTTPDAPSAGALKVIDDFLDTEVAAILAAVDTEVGALTAELAKVPKSDGAATFNATAAAQFQSEAADALAAYDPPTKAEIDAAVAPLATTAGLATVAGYLDTEITAILSAVDTEVAAIKAKTDNLPASPAATGDVPSAAANAAAVWAAGVRTLTAFAFSVDTNANATELAIKARTDLIPADPADASDIAALIDAVPTAAENAAALLDAAAAAEGLTPRQALRLILAVLTGKSTNGGKTFRDLADTKDRVAATMNAFNERTAVTRDPT